MSNPTPESHGLFAEDVTTNQAPLILAPLRPAEVLEAWAARLKPTSLRAYGADLAWWASRVGVGSAGELVRLLIGFGAGRTNLLALRGVAALRDAGRSPATCNRRLSALKSLVAAARLVGVIAWTVEVKAIKVTPLRDSRGPGLAAVKRLFAAADRQLDPVRGARDIAILTLLYSNALRVSEVAGLSLGDYVPADGRLWVLGKARNEPELVSLPKQSLEALEQWLAHRRSASATAPMFIAVDRVHHGHRLTARSMHRLVTRIGREAGIAVWPHALRHSAITTALDQGADLRHVARFSRHLDMNVLMRYDDNRSDLGGVVAQRVADAMNPLPEPLAEAPSSRPTID